MSADAIDKAAPPWGLMHGGSWSIIYSLHLWRGKKVLDVPRSVYADLADVNSVALRADRNGCTITLTGGDAGGSWRAEIVANNERVTHRTVRDGELPDYCWERTTYVRQFPAGM